MVWFWLALTIVLVVIELVTTQIVSIWFAAGSAVTAITLAIVQSAGGNLPVVWQCVIFIVVSAILLASTRKLVKKLLKKKAILEKIDESNHRFRYIVPNALFVDDDSKEIYGYKNIL